MARDTTSKKIAVLTGLTMLLGGAEISTTDAATATETEIFSLTENQNDNLLFNLFDPSLGTLTDVKFDLASSVVATPGSTIMATIQATRELFLRKSRRRARAGIHSMVPSIRRPPSMPGLAPLLRLLCLRSSVAGYVP